MEEVPDRWQIANLVDIVKFIRGVSFAKDAKRNEHKEGLVGCLRTANVQKEVNWQDLWFVPSSVVRRDEQYVRPHDILISSANSLELLGKVSLVRSIPVRSTLGTFIVMLRCYEPINPHCVYFYLSSRAFQKDVQERASTTTNISNISVGRMESIELPLPPLPEQHRIVAKIEELFSDLDAGIASLKKAKEQLKTYRQSVLKWAFEGKLTEQWRTVRQSQGTLPDAKELLEQIKEEREKKYKEECEQAKKEGKRPPRKMKELPPISEEELAELPVLPEGWEWVRFGERGIISSGPQNGLYKPQSAYGKGTLIVRIDDFYGGIIRPWHEMRRLQANVDEVTLYSLRNDDILVNRVNSMSHIGKCGLVENLAEPCVFESNMMRLSLNTLHLRPRYFTHYLSSAHGLKELRKNAKQAVNQASINQQDVRSAIIPLCTTAEQEAVVEEIETCLSEADNLEKSIDSALVKSESLRQSILKQAFSGKLVPQDPNDEPADKLLERIKTVSTADGRRLKGGTDFKGRKSSTKRKKRRG